MLGASPTGSGLEIDACMWLQECCRHVEVEEVGYSRSKIHQTTHKHHFWAQYCRGEKRGKDGVALKRLFIPLNEIPGQEAAAAYLFRIAKERTVIVVAPWAISP